MNQEYKQSKAREILWIAIALMNLIVGIHKTITHSFATSWYYFVFILISVLMYFIWRNKRIGNR